MNQKVTVVTDIKAIRKCWAWDAEARLENLVYSMKRDMHWALNSSDALMRVAWMEGLQQDYRDLGSLLKTVSKRSQMDDATVEDQG